MMRLLAPCLALVALAGCQSMDQLRALAPQQSDYTICTSLVSMNPNMRQAAGEEMARRQLDCRPYGAAMAAQQQQFNNGVMLLQASQPPIMVPAAPAPSVICTSRPGPGGTVTTVCP